MTLAKVHPYNDRWNVLNDSDEEIEKDTEKDEMPQIRRKGHMTQNALMERN